MLILLPTLGLGLFRHPLKRKVSLPIGNLTSQLFANFYLSGFDHFVKEQLNASKYLRYVDDFSLFSNDKLFLADARYVIEDYLTTLRLQIHPIKSQLFETCHGASFVGFRVLPTHTRVRSGNLVIGRRRLRRHLKRYRQAQLSATAFLQSLQSWLAHLSHADSWHLQGKLLNFLAVRQIPLELLDTLKVG